MSVSVTQCFIINNLKTINLLSSVMVLQVDWAQWGTSCLWSYEVAIRWQLCYKYIKAQLAECPRWLLPYVFGTSPRCQELLMSGQVSLFLHSLSMWVACALSKRDGLIIAELLTQQVVTPRVSFQKVQGRGYQAFYDLASEITQCHFYHILPVT